MVVAVVVAAIVLAVGVVWLLSRRRADPVDSFRRQIDALSPEARRPTIAKRTGHEDAPMIHGEDDARDGEPADEPDHGGGDGGDGEPDDGGGDGGEDPMGGPDGT